MSNATNLALLGLSGFGNAGNVLTSTGNTSAPTFSASSVGVREIRVVNRVLSRLGVNKSTGNVSVSALPDISEIPVPSWINGGHISDWSTLQYYLSAVAATNTSPASAIFLQVINSTLISNQTQSALYGGSVLAPNGKIYFLPNFASNVLILDPASETVSTIALPSGYTAQGRQYIRGVLHPNGRIYACPDFSSLGLIIDPSTNTTGTFGNFREGTGAKDINFWGAAVAPNGRIYPAPSRTTWFQFVDPSLTTSTIVGTFAGIPKVVNTSESFGISVNCVLAQNGKIYYIPSYSSTLFWYVDPQTNTLGSITNITFPTGCYWSEGVLAPNGKIYCSNYNSPNDNLAVINPDNDTVTTYNINPRWHGQSAFSAPNGKLYAFGSNNPDSVVCILDPETLSCTTISSPILAGTSGNQFSLGGTLAPNGKYYCAPYYSTSIAVFNFLNKNNFNLNVLTNPFFNR